MRSGYTLPPIQRGIIRLLIERPRNRSMLAGMVYQLENVLVVVDDSHGVGAFGATGRGTEECRVVNTYRRW